ncbi:MFS transporter [Propionivibrio dicarboxylicus]|uniref:MFS transporter, DHA2 family, multidrug resistance protein n=1 Tax=Propionivibrio dicarboxylicus TaxID=83767 RepID=A0A1G7WLE2_9RHOO|nr:MFS transporter [Propionivibrio dicarboxylicus]SDG72811.1 MFS transporter, DHA2 family, multidrug resistance protein [Propionivibrio dicarboxylicus]
MTPSTAPDQDGLPVPTRYAAMVVVILGITMSVLDSSVVNLALPTIAHELDASAAQSVWVINAYQVCILALLLPCATLGDLIGYRRVYLSGLILFTLASFACTLAGSLPVLVAARALQGLGAAGIMSVNPALVRLIYPRHLLGRGVAINSVAVATASVAGPSLAALILSLASWPWLFAINLPIGAIVLWLGFRVLPKNRTPPLPGARLSLVDVLLNVATFVLVFFGAHGLGTRGDSTMATHSLTTGAALLGVGVCVGVVYLRRQWRLPVPIFPVDLLRIPVFALSMCTSVTAFAAQTLTSIALPFLLIVAYRHSPAQAGLLITAWPLAVVVTAPLAGHLIGRYPDGLLSGIGLALLATGLGLLATMPATPSDVDIIWRLALSGAGFGLFQSPNNHTIVTSAPLHRAGGASGMLATARLTGQTCGAMTMAIVFTLTSLHDGAGPAVALSLAAGLAGAAAVFSLLRLRHASAER